MATLTTSFACNSLADEPMLVTEQRDAVLRITLNRPAKRNALNVPLLEALVATLARASTDPDTSVVVLCGAGKVFCAGVDLSEMQGRDGTAVRRRLELLADVQQRLAGLRIPVVVAVNGPAVGAGANLALCGDVVLMAEHATLAYPELSKGIAPYLVAPLLTHKVGRPAAFGLLARGAPVSAAAALERGWITGTAPSDDLANKADAWACELSTIPRQILVNTKSLMLATEGDAWTRALPKALACYTDVAS